MGICGRLADRKQGEILRGRGDSLPFHGNRDNFSSNISQKPYTKHEQEIRGGKVMDLLALEASRVLSTYFEHADEWFRRDWTKRLRLSVSKAVESVRCAMLFYVEQW